MKDFNDIGALRSVLQDVYDKCPSEAEQRLANFAGVLEQQLDFTKDDAALYASIVLTRNAGGSSEWAGWNAIKVFGTWMRMSQEGMSAALLKSETETWKFSDDLTCEHKFETYEGYVSPFWIELLGGVFKPSILRLGGVRFARPKPEGRDRLGKRRVAGIDLLHGWMKRFSIANVPSMERYF